MPQESESQTWTRSVPPAIAGGSPCSIHSMTILHADQTHPLSQVVLTDRGLVRQSYLE